MDGKTLAVVALGTTSFIVAWKLLWQGDNDTVDRMSAVVAGTGGALMVASGADAVDKAEAPLDAAAGLGTMAGLLVTLGAAKILVTGEALTPPWHSHAPVA